MKKYAFTLAEIMIVLVVIGILTGILVPAAINSMPNENVMKFKKAHNTLYRVINELVSSDKYYADGELAKMPNGNYVDNGKYFCNTFSDILSVKSTNCVTGNASKKLNGYDVVFDIEHWPLFGLDYKSMVDETCKKAAVMYGGEIITNDGIAYYEVAPGYHFGATLNDYFRNSDDESGDCRNDNDTEKCKSRYFYVTGTSDEYKGLKTIYKMFCIDVDGVPNNTTATNCVNECPFGYGIRVDGKILTGARADEWLQKSIQDKE